MFFSLVKHRKRGLKTSYSCIFPKYTLFQKCYYCHLRVFTLLFPEVKFIVGGLSAGQIVGIVVGVLLFILLVAMCVVWLVNRKHARKENQRMRDPSTRSVAVRTFIIIQIELFKSSP